VIVVYGYSQSYDSATPGYHRDPSKTLDVSRKPGLLHPTNTMHLSPRFVAIFLFSAFLMWETAFADCDWAVWSQYEDCNKDIAELQQKNGGAPTDQV
jgi:hypothetical protein